MGNQATKEHRSRSSSKKNVHWEEAERPHPPGQPVLVPPTSAAGGEHPDVVTIRWDAPISHGGCPITGYTVFHRRTGSPHWVRSTGKLVQKPPVTVSGLEPGWRYQFRVVAENAAGRSDPSPLSEPLTVTLARGTPIAAVAPHFSKELQNYAALENDKIELVVRVSGTPLPRVSWFKDSLELVSGRRNRVWSEGDEAELTSTLTIYQAALSDEGLIKCTATNRVGHVVTKANLRIEAPPAVRLPRQYEDGLLFQLGEVIRVKVSLAGRPPPRVTWMHNGEELKSDSRHEMVHNDRSASLKIADARRGDRGEYQVRASNQLGEDSAALLVTVTDRPTPPGKAIISMTLGRSVTLTWSPPDDDGGCKIGNYVVEYFKVGWNMWLKGATCRQLSTTLSDLIEGSEYKFRIKAENPYGVSDPGEESDKLFIPDPKRRILEPSDGKKGAPASSWWDKPEPPASPSRTRREDVSTESRPSRANSSFVKNPAANRGSSLPRPPDRPPRGRTPDPPKRRNRSLSRGRKSNSPEPSDQEMEMGIVKGRLFGINVSSDNVKVLRSRENVGIEQVVYTESSSRRSSISSSKDNLETRTSKEKVDEEDKLMFRDTLDTEKDPATLIKEMRKEFVEYVKGRNRWAEQTAKDDAKTNFEDTNGRIAMKNEHQLREQDDRIASEGDSSEFLLVLLPNSRGTTEERDLNRSETERALKSREPSVPPPMSLSAPELGAIEPDVPFMRNAVSSTELLHERVMARFYQEAAAEEAERVLNRRVSVERRVSLERRLSIERKNREQARLRARITSVDENDEEDFIPSNMKRFAGARPGNATLKEDASPNLSVMRQIPRIRITQEETEEEEFAELRRRLSEANAAARVEERRRQLLDVDSDDLDEEEEEEEEEEAEEEEEDKERELDASEEELETYHPRMMVTAPLSIPPPPPKSRYNTYTTTTEDDNAPSTLLTKRHSPSKGDVKPKPILKKRNSLKKERTDTPSPPTQKHARRLHSPIKKITEKLKTPELLKSSEASTDSKVSEKKPSFNLFKSKSKHIDEYPSRNNIPVRLRSKPARTPEQTPPVKRQSLSELRTTAPEEELGVSAAEAAKVKRGIPRNESLKDEESKVAISHYSDIVREFGVFYKPPQVKYLTYEELKAKAESLEKEMQANNSTANRRMSRASSRDGRLSVSSSRDFSFTRSHSSIASSVSDARSLSPDAQIMAQQAEQTVRSALSYATDVGIFLLAVWLFLFENELFAIPVLLLLAYRQIEEWVKKRLPTWFPRRIKVENVQKNRQITNSLR